MTIARSSVAQPYLETTGAKRADIILEALGSKYRYLNIDGETCIYRKLNSNYDVEISGIVTRAYKLDMTIYLWERSNQIRIVETINSIATIEELQKHLETLLASVSKGDL